MPRKGKGRGRGRGRGQQQAKQPQVGQLAAEVSDLSLEEEKRPGKQETQEVPQPVPGERHQEDKGPIAQPPEEHAPPIQQGEIKQAPRGKGKKRAQAQRQREGPPGPQIQEVKREQPEEAAATPTQSVRAQGAIPKKPFPPAQQPQKSTIQGQGPEGQRAPSERQKYEPPGQPQEQKPEMGPPQGKQAPKQSGKDKGAIPKKPPPQAQGQRQKGPGPTPQGPMPAAAPIDKRQTMTLGSTTSSGEQLARHRQETFELPKRPGFGTKGKEIRLRANFFEVRLPKIPYLYHYDVAISPEVTKQSVCRDIVNLAVDFYQQLFNGFKPAFDGRRNMYCSERLDIKDDGAKVKVTLPGVDGGKDRDFSLTVKYAGQVSIQELQQFLDGKLRGKMPQEAVQGLDIVLRQVPSMKYTPIGRAFFPPPNGNRFDLGGGCEVWSGFYQSVRPSQWKTMLLNIDVSSKGFQKTMPVIQFLVETLEIRNIRDLDRRNWAMSKFMEEKFLTTIKGLKIRKLHIKGTQVVTGLSKPAANNYFKLEDGRQVSVEQYFKEQYDINLRYPHLPCLVVGQKKNSLPMEVCEMVPTHRRRLTEQQTAAMIRRTARPAPERKAEILEWVDELEKASHGYLKDEYGMAIKKEMVSIKGRVLDAPKLQLGGQQSTLIPRDGAWDMRGKTFFKGVSVDVWALICFGDPKYCGKDTLDYFSRQMGKVCQAEGMYMNERPCVAKYARYTDEVEKIMTNLVDQYGDLRLVVVALPDRGNKDVYKEVKRVGDTVLGITTQCVQMKQFRPAKDQVCSNIAMKINAKLGGTNHAIAQEIKAPVFREPVIFFGADVTHPSPGENGIPSIAAVVASMDVNASLYCARVKPQTHIKNKAAQEIILDLAEMVKELMIEFFRKNRVKPKKIIFYRDGVSEGQFQQVLVEEVRAVQQACVNLEKGYQPLITFVVVQKRHHARLFCENEREAKGKAKNVPAGTTVDRDIVHPFEFDFYLCSHFGIQGTSRPTHYHVIYDDNQFTADDLQQLTYQLCHTYARCTRSVSLPSPAYYAHLAAFRARTLVAGGGPRGGADGPANEEEEKRTLQAYLEEIQVSEKMRGAMYFT